ncbi:MAG: G-D-S-L family lipolytic protein, partial [Gammaproteobacteria bacterium]|nr:G-D-S-L family lipolytic protein [Gammaproteobacteria bacterium]
MILINNSIEKLAVVILTCTALAACDTDFDNPVGDTSSYSNGDADFSNFVSIGDSLTAGYADAALYLDGQKNSYPAILAQQFATVGGGNFNQPLVSDNLGGLLFLGEPNSDFANRLVLDAEASSPEPIAGTPTTEVFGSPLVGSTFNNMGVPGAKLFHLGADGYGNPEGLAIGAANPYFVRFASSAGTSMIADAATQAPTFFVMWAGNNDVLSYATSGGIGENQLDHTVSPADYGSNDITNPLVF